MNQFDIW